MKKQVRMLAGVNSPTRDEGGNKEGAGIALSGHQQ